jgi:hypothetical protein
MDVFDLPIALANWNNVIKKEPVVAIKQQPTVLEKGACQINTRRTGKLEAVDLVSQCGRQMIDDVEQRRMAGAITHTQEQRSLF